MDNGILFIETSKKDNTLSNEWTHERIKKAFNNGHGNIQDLQDYAINNKKYITVTHYKTNQNILTM